MSQDRQIFNLRDPIHVFIRDLHTEL